MKPSPLLRTPWRLTCQAIPFVLLVACGQPHRPIQDDGSAVDESVRPLLVGAISAATPAGQAPPTDSVVLIRKQASVVPGMTLYLATYSPPNTADVTHVAVAASRQGRQQLVSNPSDWARLAAGWLPKAEGDAATACAEVIAFATENRYDRQGPTLYRGPGSLRGVLVTDSAALVSALAAPSATRQESGWTVDLWMVDTPGAVRYRCRLGNGFAEIEKNEQLSAGGYLRF